ncbi:CN hydrolase domain-containing protein [Sulfidibacter corallicola]|uniref:CN hydrolase domain-containing protein n=1 Tax=Sulfidibacter corallicola TaxID=2818388 RepID=A0A8A4TRB6_SULCO|nr:nitrilase-related carbon-nitrogen hydrolase [Sulfidibacter corallicola]QTD52509.1 hypothetical protein J3U87_08555 [Sulfidibacter corallicola]
MARLGLIQFDILWENAAGNAARVRDLVRQAIRTMDAADASFDLLLLPELWSCGFTMNHEAHKSFDIGFQTMQELARELDCAVMGGLPHKVEGGQENRCYLVTPDDSRHYAKLKTFNYAGEHLKYRPGSEAMRWEVAGLQISPYVCYDLRFPELVRPMMPETTMVTYVANWPSARVHHWRSLLVARAIENLCYVVGVNRIGSDGAGREYVGSSMVVAPNGDVLLDCGGGQGLFAVDIDPGEVARTREKWPFLADM